MAQSKYSKEFKVKVLSNNLPQIIKHINWLIYREELQQGELYEILKNVGYLETEIDCAVRLLKSYYAKLNRLKKRLKIMDIDSVHSNGQKKIYFLTLTLNEKAVNIKKDTMRKYIQRFLRKNCIRYFANLDYGKETGRPHFHAVVQVDKRIDFTDYLNKFGYYFYERVKTDAIDQKRITKYITKLSLHAIKDTASIDRIIYSRG